MKSHSQLFSDTKTAGYAKIVTKMKRIFRHVLTVLEYLFAFELPLINKMISHFSSVYITFNLGSLLA